MTRRAELLQKFVHFMTAFTILMKAMAKLEHPEGYGPVIALFLVSVLTIVIVTLLHNRLHHHLKLIEASVLTIECVVMAVVARLSFAEGARRFPWLYVLASIGFAVALWVRLTRSDRRPAAHTVPVPAMEQPETEKAVTLER